MAGSTNEILWRFLADTKSLDKGSRKAQGDFKQVERSSGKMQQGIGVATKAIGALGLAIGASKAKEWALDTAAMARTADQVAVSFNTVFGPAADDLRDRLDDARKSMGLGIDEMETVRTRSDNPQGEGELGRRPQRGHPPTATASASRPHSSIPSS